MKFTVKNAISLPSLGKTTLNPGQEVDIPITLIKNKDILIAIKKGLLQSSNNQTITKEVIEDMLFIGEVEENVAVKNLEQFPNINNKPKKYKGIKPVGQIKEEPKVENIDDITGLPGFPYVDVNKLNKNNFSETNSAKISPTKITKKVKFRKPKEIPPVDTNKFEKDFSNIDLE